MGANRISTVKSAKQLDREIAAALKRPSAREQPAAQEQAVAQMRMLIARETGKSPFDPSVVRAARSRIATQTRAQMRVQIAHEIGKSPFDPSVIREARRRVAKQSAFDTSAAPPARRPRPSDTKQGPQDPLAVVIEALPSIQGEGRFGDRKVFIAALWDRVGGKIHMSLLDFKRWLIDQHRQRKLVLARADLISAMPYDMVRRSEAQTEGNYSGAVFHFVVDPSV